METIIDYKLSDFLRLEDENLVEKYVSILEHLSPVQEIKNPNYKWYNKEPKTIPVKAVRELSFGEVTLIRSYFNQPSIDNILEAVKLVTGLENNKILAFTITTFYAIISNIKQEVINISNIEINELSDETFDINLETVNARQRMSKFGVLNAIDSLAKEDILRWEAIEKMPYLTVLTKLRMDREKSMIQSEVLELQKKKQLKK
jgi:hypothetical protein